MIVFDESLRLGIEEMDAEHKTLVDMLNHLQSLLKEGKRTEAMHYFNEVLLSYVETHLSHEEAFMEQIGYPELESHKKIHEVYKKEVYRLAPHVESGDEKAFREALALAWGWLYNHISKTDRKYADWYRSQAG